MPYKLADPGCQIVYEEKMVLPNHKEVDKIKVTYAEGAGSSARYHTWWYYFNPETASLEGNMLYGGDHYSYTQYEKFVEVEGLEFNQLRYSYRSDSIVNNIQLTTRYESQNIYFGELYPDEFFEPDQ